MERLSASKFKESIRNQKDYFIQTCGYLNEAKYFTFKNENELHPSDKYYIEDIALKAWAEEMSKNYDNEDKDKLRKGLCQRRGNQYSNGTLHSSSRFVAELFSKSNMNDNRKKLLELLEINPKTPGKWRLENPLPIFDEKDAHPAEMDLVYENENYFIAIESKMKEIYSNNYHNDFHLRYKEKLKPFLDGENSPFIAKVITKEEKDYIRLEPRNAKYQTNNNFYYKQQICHLLGLIKHKKDNPNQKHIFINLAFDIGDIKGFEKKNGRNEQYKENEKAIMNMLNKYFVDNGIEYKGLLTQKFTKFVY